MVRLDPGDSNNNENLATDDDVAITVMDQKRRHMTNFDLGPNLTKDSMELDPAGPKNKLMAGLAKQAHPSQ